MYRLYLYMNMYKPNLYVFYLVHLAYSSSKPFQTCPAHSPHLGPPLVIFRTKKYTISKDLGQIIISRNFTDNLLGASAARRILPSLHLFLALFIGQIL